jgi:hypothetical protein
MLLSGFWRSVGCLLGLSLEAELWDDDWVRREEYVMLRAGIREREGKNNLSEEMQLVQPYTSSCIPH